MADSVFTKIINGEIPSHKIYEDEKTFAFMDIHPIQPGMVLVVTKNPQEEAWTLPPDDYQALWDTIRKIAIKMKQVFPAKQRIGVMLEGLDVPHVHVKIFPINTGEEYRAVPDMSADPDHDALAETASKLTIN
jgi:histidine triad (HIT) family protein